jgi:hypothetical protein
MHDTFYVSGYPKSGTSHLTKLLADILNASIGGSCPEQDSIEPIAIQRDSSWIVRKGHYRIMINDDKPLLPEPHCLNITKLQNEPIFFIYRDPRDVAVSAAKYHNKPINAIIWGMTTGKLYGLPKWDTYIRMWQTYLSDKTQFIAYEDLIDDPADILRWHLTVEYDESRLLTAVEQQSFANQKPLDKHNLLRKGIAGDWKTVLTDKQAKTITDNFGELMKELEYEF